MVTKRKRVVKNTQPAKSAKKSSKKSSSQDVLLRSIQVIALLGIVVSVYLSYGHFQSASQGSACDFSETVSCSIVTGSKYGMLFNVPVAIFGVLWFILLFAVSYKAQHNKSLVPAMLLWNLFGLGFMVYLIVAEILLRAICPFCTIAHVLIVLAFVLGVLVYRQQQKVSAKHLWQLLKPWIAVAILLNVLPLLYFNWPQGQDLNYDSLTQCMTENNVVMYGSFRCSVCAKTRKMLGDSFEYINEIECHPQGENAQTQRCLDKAIEGTPTWVVEVDGIEQKRFTGFMDATELAEFSGCQAALETQTRGDQ